MGDAKPLINEQKQSFSSFEACFAKDNIKWVSTAKYDFSSDKKKDAMEMKDGSKRTIIKKGYKCTHNP